MKRILLSSSLLLLFTIFNVCAQENEMIKLTLPSGENVYYELTAKVSVTTGSNGEIKVAAANQSLVSPSGTKLVFTRGATVEPAYMRGDVNGDGDVNISDVTDLIDILLSGAAALQAADCDEDGNVNISDVTELIDYLLSGGWR